MLIGGLILPNLIGNRKQVLKGKQCIKINLIPPSGNYVIYKKLYKLLLCDFMKNLVFILNKSCDKKLRIDFGLVESSVQASGA